MVFSQESEKYLNRVKIMVSELKRDCLKMQLEAEKQASEEAILDIIISNLPEKEQDKIRQEQLKCIRLQLEVAKENLNVSLNKAEELNKTML